MKILADEQKYNKLAFIYPEKGSYRRDLYPKHLQFMAAGASHNIRAFIAGNRVGKSFSGAVELAYHLTGLYPVWWQGKRFSKPIKAWACARENKQLKESIQELLFGDFSDKGSGILPKSSLQDENGNIQTWAMAGTANCVGTALVKHHNKNGIFDGYSQVDFKTYAQGWQEFQGAKRDLIWLDEEPDDPKIYSECLTRTAGTKGKEGILYCTFTPLLGYSTVYLGFLPNGQLPQTGVHPANPNKFVITATWEDCPHLSEEWKKSQIEEYKLTDPNSIDARTKGIAAIGSGRIYPVDEEFVVVKPFEIPEYWPRAFGLDFGWNATAAVWIAQDPVTKIKYIYAEYKHGKVAPYVHIQCIKSRGEWIPGIADPSGGGRRDDGSMLIDYYRNQGLNLIAGNNSINSGIASILNQFESGTRKVFNTCTKYIDELRTYRYDMHNPNSPARNQDDHLLDADRYADSKFEYVALSEQDHDKFYNKSPYSDIISNTSSRDNLTGY